MFRYRTLNNEIIQKIDCPGCLNHVEVTVVDSLPPKPCVMIEKYKQYAERIKRLVVYEDDTWIVTFPKCGTTWAQEMIWLVNNNLDYPTARRVNLNDRYPFLEITGVLTNFPGDSIDKIEQLQRPRHIKSHLTKSLLPDQLWTKKPRIVYVARNPKDVVVSFFHHYRNIVGYRGTKEDFIEAFLNDNIIYGPFFEHLLDFWRVRHENNVLFLTYEDMKADITSVIRQTAKFFGKSYSDAEIAGLADHLSVDSMRSNPSCNNDELVKAAMHFNGKSDDNFKFIRKGTVGSFKDELDDGYIQRFDAWIADSLRNTDFKFRV